MLVELNEVRPDVWAWGDTDGVSWEYTLVTGTKPLEAVVPTTDKNKTKQIIKLKEAGFTADEIIEMNKEGML